MGTADPLALFPIVIRVPIAWGEMDAFGHVNNIVYFRYFESARIAYLEAIGFRGDTPDRVGPILASTECRFRRPLTYPDTLSVGARAASVAEDRFAMEYVIVSDTLRDIAAHGAGVVVAYDYAGMCKAALPDPVRARIGEVEADSDAERGRP